MTAPYHAFTADEHEDHFDLLLAVAEDKLEWLVLAVLWEARSSDYAGFNSDFHWPYDRDREDMSLLEELYWMMHDPQRLFYEDSYAAHLRQFAQAKMKWLTPSEEEALILLMTEDPDTVRSRWLVLEEVRDAVAREAVRMMGNCDLQGIEEACLGRGLARRSDLKEDE